MLDYKPFIENSAFKKPTLFCLFILVSLVNAQQPLTRIHFLMDNNDYKTCEVILDSCTNKNYQTDSVLFYRALTAIKMGNKEKCRDYCHRLSKEYPQFGEVHYTRGLLYFAEENYGKSANEFTKVLQSNPADFRALYDRSIALGMLEDYKDALKDLDACIKINANYSKAYYSRAYWLEFTGNFVDAAKDYERTIELDAKNYDAYFGLAYSYKIQKDPTRACETIRRAIAAGSQIAEELKESFCREALTH